MPAAGVPLSVPVPLPLSTNVTPAGSAAPPRASVGSGKPLVVTVNVPGVPTVNVVVAALVIAGASLTFNVKVCVPFGRTPFDAVNVSADGPPVAAPGVPLNVPVPLPLSTNVTPAGSEPLTEIAGVGLPMAVTVNVPAVPAVNVVLLALVIEGGSLTVSVKACGGVAPTALVAVNEIA